jgi:hypothetical protein
MSNTITLPVYNKTKKDYVGSIQCPIEYKSEEIIITFHGDLLTKIEIVEQ